MDVQLNKADVDVTGLGAGKVRVGIVNCPVLIEVPGPAADCALTKNVKFWPAILVNVADRVNPVLTQPAPLKLYSYDVGVVPPDGGSHVNVLFVPFPKVLWRFVGGPGTGARVVNAVPATVCVSPVVDVTVSVGVYVVLPTKSVGGVVVKDSVVPVYGDVAPAGDKDKDQDAWSLDDQSISAEVEFLVSINGAVVILGTIKDGVSTAELSEVGPTDLTEKTFCEP